jgi:hypothetical protein
MGLLASMAATSGCDRETAPLIKPEVTSVNNFENQDFTVKREINIGVEEPAKFYRAFNNPDCTAAFQFKALIDSLAPQSNLTQATAWGEFLSTAPSISKKFIMAIRGEMGKYTMEELLEKGPEVDRSKDLSEKLMSGVFAIERLSESNGGKNLGATEFSNLKTRISIAVNSYVDDVLLK